MQPTTIWVLYRNAQITHSGIISSLLEHREACLTSVWTGPHFCLPGQSTLGLFRKPALVTPLFCSGVRLASATAVSSSKRTSSASSRQGDRPLLLIWGCQEQILLYGRCREHQRLTGIIQFLYRHYHSSARPPLPTIIVVFGRKMFPVELLLTEDPCDCLTRRLYVQLFRGRSSRYSLGTPHAYINPAGNAVAASPPWFGGVPTQGEVLTTS